MDNPIVVVHIESDGQRGGYTGYIEFYEPVSFPEHRNLTETRVEVHADSLNSVFEHIHFELLQGQV